MDKSLLPSADEFRRGKLRGGGARTTLGTPEKGCADSEVEQYRLLHDALSDDTLQTRRTGTQTRAALVAGLPPHDGRVAPGQD